MNKIIILIIGIFVMAGLVYALATFTAAGGNLRVSSLQKGLVGHWALDGESYDSNTERVTDKTPYENHGTNYGATLITDQMGQSDRAMSFDGVDDYVDISKDLTGGLTEITIAAWVNAQQAANLIRASGNAFILHFRGAGFYLTAENTTTSDYLYWNPSPPLDTWVHLVATWSNPTVGDGKMKLYINGVKQSTERAFDGGATGKLRASTYTWIGRYFNTGQPWFNGSISDIRIYNHALSADEIDTLYHSYRPKVASGSLQKGLVFDMPLNSKYTKDETAGLEVMTDRTPYSNDGQNNGSTVGGDYTDFDGNDYIDLPNDIGYSSQVSAFAWFKSSGSPPGNYHIIFGGSQLEISIPDPGGSLRTGIQTTVNRFVSNHGSGLVDGEWHFIGFTFDGSVKKSYIDGEFVGEQTGITGDLLYSFSYRRMGRHGSSGVYYANGSISSVKIYNRALSPSEIKLLYDKGR